MSKYTSEYRDEISSRSVSELKVLAELRGMQSGFKFAEAFRLLRANIFH